jgi:hypothetical protein
MTGQILRMPGQNVQHSPMVRRGPKVRIPDDVVVERFNAGKSDAEMAEGYPGVDASYIFKRRMKLRLLRQAGGKGTKRSPREKSTKRHSAFTNEGKPITLPALDNAALSEGRTIYVSTVVPVEGLRNLLIEGVNSRKVGSHISKGPLKGFPIFTLTLEERKTCPTSCHHWRSCMGNSMPFAKRIEHGEAFERRLESEITILQSRFPRGFAIRLHGLGDFYSVEYVQLWARFLKQFRSLMVFGFSARWERDDPIAMALVPLVMAEWPRFAIRFSNAPIDECSTVSIEHWKQKPKDAIICPMQYGPKKPDSCGACALCWHSKQRIAFILHG